MKLPLLQIMTTENLYEYSLFGSDTYGWVYKQAGSMLKTIKESFDHHQGLEVFG